MATILEQYHQTKQQLDVKIANNQMTAEQVLGYQELLYRISVLESCMNFVKTAPISENMKVMGDHYQIVEALFVSLTQERQIGVNANDRIQNQRTTALGNLQTVVNSFRKQFQSFKPATPEAYRAAVGKMINTILPAWLQYRFTYVPF